MRAAVSVLPGGVVEIEGDEVVDRAGLEAELLVIVGKGG